MSGRGSRGIPIVALARRPLTGGDGGASTTPKADLCKHLARVGAFLGIAIIAYHPFGTWWINNPSPRWDPNRTSASWDTHDWNWDPIDCIYFALVTMTTVGYGDMYPVTSLGQFVACAAMVCGIVVLSVPITVIGANFDEETREQHRINQLRKRVLQMEKLRIEDTLKASGVVTEAAVAGMQEINCLLDDYHQNVVGDVNMFVAKAEPTFTQLVRKVVIHSRVFADMSGPSSQTMTTGAVSPGTEVEVES